MGPPPREEKGLQNIPVTRAGEKCGWGEVHREAECEEENRRVKFPRQRSPCGFGQKVCENPFSKKEKKSSHGVGTRNGEGTGVANLGIFSPGSFIKKKKIKKRLEEAVNFP